MQYLQEFINHLNFKGDRPHTIYNYRHYLTDWLTFLGDKEPQTCIAEHLRRYKSDRTKKSVWTHIRHYAAWCAAEGLIERDWTKKVHLRFAPAPVSPTLTVEEFDKILRATPNTMPGKRDKALFAVIFYTGARRTAICRLRRENINLKDRLIFIKTKGDKEQFLALPAPAAQALNVWLAQSKGIDSPYVFPSTHHPQKSIEPTHITHELPRLAKLAGLSKRVYVHLLRHSFATLMDSEGIPESTIQALLGHANLNTTLDYIHRLRSAKAALDAVDKVFKKAA